MARRVPRGRKTPTAIERIERSWWPWGAVSIFIAAIVLLVIYFLAYGWS